jgi:hypothetical protein
MEVSRKHCLFEQWVIADQARVDNEVAVFGARGDRNIGLAGVQIDGLCAYEDDCVTVRAKRLQGVEQHLARSD